MREWRLKVNYQTVYKVMIRDDGCHAGNIQRDLDNRKHKQLQKAYLALNRMSSPTESF